MASDLREWGTKNSLEADTVDKIISEGFTTMDIIKLMAPKHVKALKLNMGQSLALEHALKSLRPEASIEDEEEPQGGAAQGPQSQSDTSPTPSKGDELTSLLAQLKDTGLLGDSDEKNRAARPQGKEKPLLVQDFVNNLPGYSNGQEREVLSLGGDQRLLVSSAKRLNPENTSLPQWIRGHLKIQDELIERGELSTIADIKAYAKYGMKIADMCALYPLSRVMRFDAEYRVKVFEGALKWGDADPELMNFCVFVHYTRNTSSTPIRKRDQMPLDPASGREICRNFNLQKGCTLKFCKFAHVCTKCNLGHPEFRHV